MTWQAFPRPPLRETGWRAALRTHGKRGFRFAGNHYFHTITFFGDVIQYGGNDRTGNACGNTDVRSQGSWLGEECVLQGYMGYLENLDSWHGVLSWIYLTRWCNNGYGLKRGLIGQPCITSCQVKGGGQRGKKKQIDIQINKMFKADVNQMTIISLAFRLCTIWLCMKILKYGWHHQNLFI